MNHFDFVSSSCCIVTLVVLSSILTASVLVIQSSRCLWSALRSRWRWIALAVCRRKVRID